MSRLGLRNILISFFVVIWILVFHYESIRYFYLEPFLKKPLPQMRFLFPPAGWIMFFNVGDSFVYTEVYGRRNESESLERIDPHDILQTRHLAYDNIHRNVLSVALSLNEENSFCTFMHRKFPQYHNFVVTEVEYPSLTQRPQERRESPVYTCH